MASLLARIGKSFGWTSSPGPMSVPGNMSMDGWIPLSWPTNFGQVAFDPIDTGGVNSVVYSCIMLYARTIAQLPGQHLRRQANGAWQPVENTALARILIQPNSYQTPSDFMTNMVVALLAEGNGIAVGFRNDRYEITELHQLPWRHCMPMFAPETGDVFYSIGGNPAIAYAQDPAFQNGERWVVPQADILHFRGPADPRNPLVGESPLIAGGLPIAMNTGGAAFYRSFFRNMSRPSGVLRTDMTLTKAQVDELRARWEEHTKGPGIGGTPILTAGLDWKQTGFNAADAQIAESMKYAVADIARLFGVPLALIDDMSGSTYSNVENLIMAWLRQGLGYYIKHIEYAYDQTFRTLGSFTDETNFDVDQLLRPDFKSRIEGLTKAVQGGVYSPNEARKKEGLAPATDGDEPRLQAQVVPLSAWDKASAQPAPSAPAAAAPTAADQEQ
jgi:HK97 family phage portal protein